VQILDSSIGKDKKTCIRTIKMASSIAWDSPVDTRIQIIAERLASDSNEEFRAKRVPGLKSLLDDYIAPDVDVDSVVFNRRLLQVFKQSDDQTYEHLLAQHTPDEQRRIEAFVAGEKPEEVCKDFTMGPSLGYRHLLEKMRSSESVARVSVAGPRAIRGLSNDDLEKTDGDWFHGAVRKLADFFHLDGDKHTVTVCAMPPLYIPASLWLTRTSGIQGCRVPELGSEREKQAAVDVRADDNKRCTANRGVCCKAQHARAVFGLSCVYLLAATLPSWLTCFAVRSLVVASLWPGWTDINLSA
jgi:hypothetical protein